ncbi:MAG: hypothetical protein ACTIMT_15025 [Marinomonadaceae bacterium]
MLFTSPTGVSLWRFFTAAAYLIVGQYDRRHDGNMTMKATLSQDHVAAALNEYQCLFLRLSLGSLSKPELETKKR